MDAQGFRDFLKAMDLAQGEINASLALAERFESYLETIGHSKATKADVDAFSSTLIEKGDNSLANYYALARYGRFIKNDDIYVGIVDLLDGAEAMDNLYEKTGVVLGLDTQTLVFQGVTLPPLGTPNREKVQTTKRVIPRLVEFVKPGECDQILADSLRDLDEAWFQDDKKLYEECQDFDAFLDLNAQNFIDLLSRIRDEGGLFFSQPITDEVLEFVREEPLIARGVKEGNILYEVKIPHMTVEFLAEADPQMKRFYYCHCPWVKEALKDEEAGISPTFCTCSAGFHKKRWEVILDQPLKAEIVESVLKGDQWCKIAIYLPEGI